MKKILIFLVIVISILIAITYINWNTREKSSDLNYNFKDKWEAKAPNLFKSIGYNKLVESRNLDKISESQKQLIGEVTNPFGIRDDILDYILTYIPESDTRSRIAAIKMAYYDQMEIGVTDDKIINNYANKALAAVYCMQLPMSKLDSFGKGYDKLLRNTQLKKNEQNRIENLLNNHVISADFGDVGNKKLKLKDQCDYFLGYK